MSRTVEAAFADLLAAEPSRPFVTYYDERTGERTELSVRSLANWVAKTHHLLQTELGLGAEDAAWLELPAHWISVPILLGCATAGVQVTSSPANADVAFGLPEAVRRADVPDRFAVSPGRAAVGFVPTDLPDGVHDYVAAVRPQADAWATVAFGAAADDPWDESRSRAELYDEARGRADELGFGPGARVLWTRGWSGPADWLAGLFAPLVVGGSVVYVAPGANPAALARRAEQERVTITA